MKSTSLIRVISNSASKSIQTPRSSHNLFTKTLISTSKANFSWKSKPQFSSLFLSGLGLSFAGIATTMTAIAAEKDKDKKDTVVEVKNIFNDDKNFNCFGCGKSNKIGLQLKFFHNQDKDFLFTTFQFNNNQVGFNNVVHGGFVGLIIDEVAFQCLFNKHKLLALTSKMEVEYKGVCRPNEKLQARAMIEQRKGRNFNIRVILVDSQERVLAVGKVNYIVPRKSVLESALGKLPDSYLQYVSKDDDDPFASSNNGNSKL